MDYLKETIAAFRDLHKLSAPKVFHFEARERVESVIARRNLLHLWQDFEEGVQLRPEDANDGPGAVFRRFKIS